MPAQTDRVTIPWHKRADSPYLSSIPGKYFHDSKAKVKLFGGAVGGTKTTTLSCDILYQSLRTANNRGFAGERDFDDLRRGLYTEIMEWLPEPRKLADGRDLYVHNKSEHWIRFYNGSEIHFVELKDEPRNVNLGWAAIDQAERVPEKSFEWMTTRLRLEDVDYRPLMMSANPEPGWLYRKMVQPAGLVHTGILRRTGQELVVYRTPEGFEFIPAFPEDNPHLPEDYVSTLYNTLSATRVERLLKGVWDTVEGAIYDQLDRDKHLVRLPYGPIWIDGAEGVDYGDVHLSATVAVTKTQNQDFWVRACWAEPTGDPQKISDAVRSHEVLYGIRRGRVDPNQAVLAANLGYSIAKRGPYRKERIGHVTKLLNNNALFFDINGPGVRELFEECQAYRTVHVETEARSEDVVVRKDEDRVAALEYAIEELVGGDNLHYLPPTTRTINWVKERASGISKHVGQDKSNFGKSRSSGATPDRSSAIGFRIGRN